MPDEALHPACAVCGTRSAGLHKNHEGQGPIAEQQLKAATTPRKDWFPKTKPSGNATDRTPAMYYLSNTR